ncbi:MAG: hypothetical protein JXR07_10365 [Reichenbachiella sp.]
MKSVIILVTTTLLLSISKFPVQASTDNEINVFIDCNSCDQNFLRKEINYINHVRNIQDADIYILINRVRSAASQIYDFTLIGHNQFDGIGNEFEYALSNTLTSDERRIAIKNVIEKSLVAYLIHTPMNNELSLDINKNVLRHETPSIVDDPWNNWVFDLYGQLNFDHQQARRKFEIRSGFNAQYVTEDWRIKSNLRYESSKLTIIEDSSSIVSIREKKYANASAVKSLGSHWSTGVFSGINANSYENILRRIYVGPALEFSFFPYTEVLQKEITLAYRVGLIRQNYIEESIYQVFNDNYMNQSISLNIKYRQPWGTISTNISGSHAINNFDRNRLELYNYANIRVFKGFSIRFSADMDLIQDQISLPAGNASLEDVLLQQRAIASNFDLTLGVGINYTFGSIYNNVLNTRL